VNHAAPAEKERKREREREEPCSGNKVRFLGAPFADDRELYVRGNAAVFPILRNFPSTPGSLFSKRRNEAETEVLGGIGH